jgi:hypothetical protein
MAVDLNGDLNIKYFHRVASGRKRKNTILSLEHGENTIEGDENLLAHATEYYSELFGPAPKFNIQINESLWEGAIRLSESDNDQLCRPFSETEIWNALSQMEKNKAAGLDNIPIEFYQDCWQTVKADILHLFSDFRQGSVDISRINYGIITLLPKTSDAAIIQQYRPCLLNCLYKLITKTLTLRIETFAEKLIHPAQSAFMRVTGVLTLHEILHETKMKNECGIILKLDFEKAYDKVNCSMLFICLKASGFNETWCGWIKQVVAGGTISVKVNNLRGPCIKSHEGMRQGDPLSPILFNFVASVCR